MKDRYKFRGYNKNLKQWFYGGYVTQAEYTDSPFEQPGTKPAPVNHFIVFEEPGDWGLPTKLKLALVDKESVGQCTGIKDVKGKLIYEGDIVKLTKNDNPYMNNIIGIVRYTQKEAIFYIDIFKSSAWYEFNEVEKKGLTIIGNIYEKSGKELLK